MLLTWLGQAGFLIEGIRTRVLIDPFLSDHPSRIYPPPDKDSYIDRIDVVLITHEHLDHLDRDLIPRIVDLNPQVRIVVPTPLTQLIPDKLESNLHRVQPGASVTVGDFTVGVTPSYHAVEVEEPYGTGTQTGGDVRFVGYVIAANDCVLYHSGDTIVTAALIENLDRHDIDVAVLPINGRSYFREATGLVGNMDVRDAVGLAVRIGAQILVPMHWDLFAGNTESPGRVADEVAETGAALHVLTLARGCQVQIAIHMMHDPCKVHPAS